MRAENATSVVDGNAIAGLLAEALEGDATTLVGVCRECGSRASLAQTLVELDDFAAIVRCRTCTHTLFTVLRQDGVLRLVIQSLRELQRQ